MIKKILIAMGLVTFSFLAYLYFGFFIYMEEKINFVNDKIANEEYSEAFKAFDTSFYDKDYYKKEIGDMTLVQFDAIGVSVQEKLNEDDEVEFTYPVFHESAEFILFNVDSELKLNTTTKVVGYRNGLEIDVNLNYLTLHNEFNIFAFSINSVENSIIDEVVFYTTEVVTEADEETDIEEVTKDVEIYTIDLESKDFSFDETHSLAWEDFLDRYNTFYYNYEKTGVYDNDEYQAFIIERDEILVELDYATSITEEMAQLTSLKVKMVVLIVVLALINTIIVVLLFIRAKKKAVPINTFHSAKKLDKKNVIEAKEDKKVVEKEIEVAEDTTQEDKKEDKE